MKKFVFIDIDGTLYDKVKEVGYWYYVNDLVTNISKNGNIYSCDIDKYNTSVEFSTNRNEEIDDLECDCSFYENEDTFCPHVYALVCYAFNVPKEPSKCSIKILEKYNKSNEIKKELEEEKVERKRISKVKYTGFIDELLNNEESKQEQVNRYEKDYEPYQFEEEELEEDDYYYEDDNEK